MLLKKDEFEAEAVFQIAMYRARKLLEAGLIDRELYEEYQAILSQKYHPVIGALLSEKPLLEADYRALLCVTKSEGQEDANHKDSATDCSKSET